MACMDIIIVGKASHNRNDPPQIVYCGQDNAAAQEAVRAAAAAGKLIRFYALDPEPHRPITVSVADTGKPAEAVKTEPEKKAGKK